WWVLITAAFSHNMFLHFLINMLILNNFGRILERVLGGRYILKFYLVAAIVSSLAHAVVSNLIMGAPDLPALGASGSIAGFILIFCLMFPRETILVFGLI